MKHLILMSVLLLLLSCDGRQDGSTFDVAQDDEEMLQAMEEARSSIQSFINALANKSPSRQNYGLKARFEDGEAVEHIWIENPTYDGALFSGTVGNDPEWVSNVRYGDAVKIPHERVSDWMYTDGNILKGGFTVRVLRDKMSPEERELFDREFPYIIE